MLLGLDVVVSERMVESRFDKVTALVSGARWPNEPMFVDMPNSGHARLVSGARLRWSLQQITSCVN
jgi:hypothetical protein